MPPSKGKSQPDALTRATCCSTSTASLLILAPWSNEKIDAIARGGPEGMRLVTLKAVSGPGDDGEPVMTFMLPEED